MEKKYLIELDKMIGEKSEQDDEYLKWKKEEAEILATSGKEYLIDTIEYKKFMEKYNNLNYNFGYGKLYRIDKIIKLFNKYLFTEDLSDIDIQKNISIFNYIKIANMYLEFLSDNYYTYSGEYNNLFEDKKRISTDEIQKEIHNLFKLYKAAINSNENYYFNEYIYNIPDLQQKLINYFDPFNQNFVRLLIKLNNIINTKKYNEFLLYKLLEYKMDKELFEFLEENPETFNKHVIEHVYDYNSARIVFEILNNKVNKINNKKLQLDYYYNEILSIISKSNDSFFKNIFDKIKFNNIENKIDIFEKVDTFIELEDLLFKKLKIQGTWSYCQSPNTYNSILEKYRTFNNPKEVKEENIFSYVIKKSETVDFDDTTTIDLDKINRISIDINSVNFSDKIKEICTFSSPSEEVVFDENSDDFVYKYITNDYQTENRLRLLFEEIKNNFLTLDNDLPVIKNWIESFNGINNIDLLLKKSEETMQIFELNETKKYLYSYDDSLEYNTEEAEKMLYEDLISVNSIYANYLDELKKITKVRKALLSASYIWNIYNKLQSKELDKNGIDYTPIVANYFKAVELLLYRKIRDKYQQLTNNGINLKKPYSVTGKKINLLDNNDNEITLGEMIKYIKREDKIINNQTDKNTFVENLEMWVKDVRNSHFHKDLIVSKAKAYDFKYRTIFIIIEILKNI